MISDNEICMERGRLMATLFYLHARPLILILSLLALALLAAGIFIDIRWAIVFLMIVFIVAPMAMSFLYFYHGLKPATAANVVPHYITFTPEGFSLDIIEREADPKWNDDTEQEPESGEEDKNDQESEVKEKETKIRYTIPYPYPSIKQCRPGRDGYIITFDDSAAGFVWIPYTLLAGQADMKNIIASLKNCKSR